VNDQGGAHPSGGEGVVWSVVGTLLGGPLVWGAVGYGIDSLTGASWLTPAGILLGFATSLYIIYVKHVRG
jgi:hypothetical protein